MVKKSIGIATSHIGIPPGFDSSFLLMHINGRQQVLAQMVIRFLPPMWDTQIEFLTLGFGLAQTQLFQADEE